MTLADYVLEHTVRGECKCGRCADRGETPDPDGHTVDIHFFKVAAANDPSIDEFVRLTREHGGEFVDINPLDGQEHGYIELGAWIGDQGLAMQYMALGVLLKIFRLLTPALVFPTLGKDAHDQMAQLGLVTVVAA